MTKLSAIIIAKNAEDLIADCLDSVSFCDEVVVIDDKSTDRTVDIAERMGAKVASHTSGSFAEKRNYGLKKAHGKWVLYIDADERVTPTLKDAILAIVDKDKSEDVAYRLERKNFYLGNYQWPQTEKLERLFKKSHLEEWYGDIHETAKVNGSIGDLDGFLHHFSHQDLTSMVAKTIEWSKIEAELRYKANHPQMSWWRFFRVMLTAFYQSYIKQEGWRVGTVGLIESLFQSFSMFITYARLWEMQQKKTIEKN